MVGRTGVQTGECLVTVIYIRVLFNTIMHYSTYENTNNQSSRPLAKERTLERDPFRAHHLLNSIPNIMTILPPAEQHDFVLILSRSLHENLRDQHRQWTLLFSQIATIAIVQYSPEDT